MSAEATTAGFIFLAVVAAVLLLLPRWPRSRLPSNSDALASLFMMRMTRLALVVMWWWVGWHFLGTG